MDLLSKDIILLIVGILVFFIGPRVFSWSVGAPPKDPILLMRYYHNEDNQKTIPRAFGAVFCLIWILLKIKKFLFQ